MKKLLVAFALALIVAMPNGAAAEGKKALMGTLGGAALGGLLGSQVGSGKGKLAATGAGVLLGAFLGHGIGKSLDNADRAAMGQSQQQALEYTPSNQAVPWRNPDSGHSGTIVPRPAYQTASGQYCREFTQSVTVGGRTEQAYGTACRQPDGSWQIINQ